MIAHQIYDPGLEVNRQVRQDTLLFLHKHALIPDLVYLSSDGWVEAIYDVPIGDKSILRLWNTLETQGLVTLDTLPRYHPIDNKTGRIKVHFKVNSMTSSLWKRITGR